jgi:hypothetical protein
VAKGPVHVDLIGPVHARGERHRAGADAFRAHVVVEVAADVVPAEVHGVGRHDEGDVGAEDEVLRDEGPEVGVVALAAVAVERAARAVAVPGADEKIRAAGGPLVVAVPVGGGGSKSQTPTRTDRGSSGSWYSMQGVPGLVVPLQFSVLPLCAVPRLATGPGVPS